MNKEEFNKYYNPIKDFFSNKRVQNILVAVLFLGILFLGTFIRLQPILTGNLIDKTTGDYTPLALDPYYFLRVSETLIANDGVLPEVDTMRYQALNSTWSDELLPKSTVAIYKTIKIFNSDATLNFANVLNPVIFFIIGMILFFFIALIITKNKWIATISSFILVIIPPYLYRTLAGFSDHESIGMTGFFLSMFAFVFGLFYLEKKKLSTVKSTIFGLLAGFSTMIAVATWGGGAKFLFMIFPLAFITVWLTRDNKSLVNRTLFYSSWVVGFLLSAPIFGYEIIRVMSSYMLNSTGILTPFVLGYILVETIILKSNFSEKIKTNSKLLSVLATVFVGGLFYQIVVGNVFAMIGNLFHALVNPFGTERVTITVAENKQPYLTELISQVGKFIFYTFLVGCFIVGKKIGNGIENKKLNYLFTASFALFIIGILFSRISQDSVLNGENFFSHAFFFITFLIFAVSTIYIYNKSEWNIETKWIFIAAWMIPMLLSVRSAIRVFFAIVPFISLMVPIALFEIAKWGRKNKDELIKTSSIILTIILSVMIVWTSFTFYNTDVYQAKGQTPSYTEDWQNAMSWVRNNTMENDVFLHWWDYGYWVQTGGDRPTVTDGGHFNGYWDHLIGRYVLTTPYPETAKSFMLAHNVSYLLIDPTDIGKYSAYSSIGDDNETPDRSSWISTFVSSDEDTQETRNEIVRLYRGGIYLDEDIRYKEGDVDLFLPKGKAALLGIIISKTNNGYSQPIGIFMNNNNQYRIPIRKLASSENFVDFKTGIDSTVFLYSSVKTTASGQSFDIDGAAMYLSGKVQNSLVAKLYIMNDPLDEYEELKLVHEEAKYPVPFYYGNSYFGPIKIYKVNKEEMTDIIERPEFRNETGGYGEFDDLEFIKNQ